MTPEQATGSVAGRKMHEGEVDIDEALVARLVALQFPQFADLPVRAVPSTGTVNAIYRLGDHLCARLPRVASRAADLEKEVTWLPKLAPCLSLRVPEVAAIGHPASGYPLPWAIYRWMDVLVFHPAGEPHANHYHDGGARLFTIEMEPWWLERVPPPSGGWQHPRQFEGGLSIGLALRLYTEFRARDAWAPAVMEGLMLELLAEAFRQRETAAGGRPPRWLAQVREILRTQFMQSWSLADLAQTVGCIPPIWRASFAATITARSASTSASSASSRPGASSRIPTRLWPTSPWRPASLTRAIFPGCSNAGPG